MSEKQLDTIEFKLNTEWEKDELYIWKNYWVTIFINGVDLKQLVVEYANKSFDLNDTKERFADLWLEWTMYAMGLLEPDSTGVYKGDVLTCSCKCVGCFTIQCKIVENKETVVWKNFTDLNKEDYQIPEMRFDKNQYTEQLELLKTFFKNADTELKDRYILKNDEWVEFIPKA
ncbi:MAG: hypothetical protein H6587_06045 [Flavobacteriales bacterium]|nr:hypothetical protein [Flavobacteriales bacterium]MCB9364109.1 hypothetical protein [Flavobacteriales bacterium]